MNYEKIVRSVAKIRIMRAHALNNRSGLKNRSNPSNRMKEHYQQAGTPAYPDITFIFDAKIRFFVQLCKFLINNLCNSHFFSTFAR